MTKKIPPSPDGAPGLSEFMALSVWDIANRWHNLDPNATDPKNLPLPVQDTLRTLCLALETQMMPASNRLGDDYGIVSKGPKYNTWQTHVSAAELARGYRAAVDDYTREHREAVAGLESCVEQRNYDREKLDSVYVSALGIQQFCKLSHLPLPAFWFPGQKNEVIAPPRTEQLDKAVCQGIARTLWDIQPALTIQALIDHPAIRQHGNGGLYVEKTLRKWLSEVDPRSTEAKTGRPRNPKPDPSPPE